MKILIDGHNISLKQGTGIATYANNIANLLRLRGHETGVLLSNGVNSKDSQLFKEIRFLDESSKPKKPYLIRKANWYLGGVSSVWKKSPIEISSTKTKVDKSILFEGLSGFDRILASNDIFSSSVRSYRVLVRLTTIDLLDFDVAHWTYPVPIRGANCKNVYTLHDLVPLKFPNSTLDNKKNYYNLCKKIASTASCIITVSETSRKDIIELLDVRPEKVINTFQYVNFPAEVISRGPSAVSSKVSEIFNLPYKGYFLFYGAIEPKKNINRLIEAYLLADVDSPLVIVESGGWLKEEQLKILSMLDSIPKSARRNKIIRFEYLPRELLILLVQGAKATTFPSIYEGFGLPVLESMTLNTAVITSNHGALKEVAGNAACYVDPFDVSSIRSALHKIESDDLYRIGLEREGLAQASLSQFSMNYYYDKLMCAYSL